MGFIKPNEKVHENAVLKFRQIMSFNCIPIETINFKDGFICIMLQTRLHFCQIFNTKNAHHIFQSQTHFYICYLLTYMT